MLALIAHIENDPLRGILLTLWFPFELLPWLWTVAINDPRQLLTARPYALFFAMFCASIDGYFVD